MKRDLYHSRLIAAVTGLGESAENHHRFIEEAVSGDRRAAGTGNRKR